MSISLNITRQAFNIIVVFSSGGYMTLKEFEKIYQELQSKNSKILILGFNNQKPIDYIKIEVFEVVVNKDECMHTFSGKPDWTKNFVFLVGELCGVKSRKVTCQKLSKHSFVSTYESRRAIPSGDHVTEEGEYEFDAEIRVDKEYWEERAKNPDKPQEWKHKTEAHKNAAIAGLAVLGRSKADTGAEKRAVIKVLKFPKPDYKMVGTHIFCFRCSPNMENREMRNSYLSIGNPSASVFGSTPQIEHKESDVIEQEPEPSAIFQITEKREALKKNAALYKLAGMVIDTESHSEEFLGFLKDFNSNSDKTGALIGWVKKFEPVDPIVETGSSEIKTNYLKEWGNK